MTMGIPVAYLPVSLDGVLHTENHRRWLQFRVQQEQASAHKRPPQVLRAEEVEGLHLVEEEVDDLMEM